MRQRRLDFRSSDFRIPGFFRDAVSHEVEPVRSADPGPPPDGVGAGPGAADLLRSGGGSGLLPGSADTGPGGEPPESHPDGGLPPGGGKFRRALPDVLAAGTVVGRGAADADPRHARRDPRHDHGRRHRESAHPAHGQDPNGSRAARHAALDRPFAGAPRALPPPGDRLLLRGTRSRPSLSFSRRSVSSSRTAGCLFRHPRRRPGHRFPSSSI